MDWGIFALDAVGLLLFFLPGVIAFAVDFSTGAIYLPPPNIGYGKNEPKAKDSQFVTVQVPHEGIDSRAVGAGGFATCGSRRVADRWPI